MQSTLKIILWSSLLSFRAIAQKDSTIAVPGTHCSLIPPKGFVIADRFSGFQNNSTGSSIMVTELAENYDKIIVSLTSEAFLTQKMILTSTEKIAFNGKDATLFSATQTQNGIEFNKLMLVFGSDSKTILVNGIYPVSANQLEKSIRGSLFTTTYKDKQLNQVAPIFTISTEGTDFKKVNSYGVSSVYSTDSISSKLPNAPLFILNNSVSKIAPENRKSYAESRIMTLPRGDENKITSVSPIIIDNLSGYEIQANGISKTGSPQSIYQVILYNIEGDYYIMVGMANTDIENTIKQFKKLAQTFTLRES